MNREEILDELTQDVLTYVMHGSFPERHFVEEIKPSELDERFADYESLIRLHFVLRPEVVAFVESLPEHLRHVKTQTENVSKTVRGHVEGRINWTKTVRNRYARNPHDDALFVCEDRSENYDVDENIVLKQLLSVIYTTLAEAEQYLKSEYDWVTERWQENLELVDVMMDIFDRNVHVRRIRDPEVYEPTERMLITAEQSRQGLYRTAASLLRDYRDGLSGDADAIKSLLESTAITPDDDETLFELFVLFKYISAIESMEDGRFTLNTIRTDKQEIARLENADVETEIVIYHDASARRRNVSFDSSPDGDRTDFSRHEMVHRESVRTARQYFDNEDLGNHTGRPDVIVIEVDRDDHREYLITEVKYSSRQETVREGIKETLEYLAFLKHEDEFVYDSDTHYFGSGWNGVLVVQDLNRSDVAGFEEQDGQPIRILQASEVQDRLQDVLASVL
ncbi:MAG: hypothetical protein ABEJ58_08980 [Halodesulfurarchaeum sp.]